jgi:hypothetical protein
MGADHELERLLTRARGDTAVLAEDALYERAFRTMRAWEMFRPHYETYLAEVASGRS